MAQPPNDDCSDALTLCADQPLVGNNTGATGAPGFCPGTSSVLWYTFTTNSLGGTVDISLSGINCPSVAGMDNELSLIVLNGDGSCQLGQFTAASPCLQDSMDFTLTTPTLMPNTTYWLLVGGVANNGASIPAQCDFSLTMNGPGADIVDVDFDAGPSVEIGNGEFTQLEAIGGSTYLWTPNSGLSGDNIADPIASPSETTTYTVTTEINDCVYSDQLIVEVIRRIDPPNTFTPNGDSYNDTWRIFGIEDYPSCEVLIYNRWGQRVFRSVGYKEPWDGDRLPMATYYYHIELNQLEGRSTPYTGSVTIVR